MVWRLDSLFEHYGTDSHIPIDEECLSIGKEE